MEPRPKLVCLYVRPSHLCIELKVETTELSSTLHGKRRFQFADAKDIGEILK